MQERNAIYQRDKADNNVSHVLYQIEQKGKKQWKRRVLLST